MQVSAREERVVIERRLSKFSHEQLMKLGDATGIMVPPAYSRAECVTYILTAMGYPKPPTNNRVEVAPVGAPVYTDAELRANLDNYVQDEIALMRACASMLQTLYDINKSTHATPTKKYTQEVRKELGFYHGHTNLPRIVDILRMLLGPDAYA